MPRVSVIAKTYAKTLFLASKNNNSIDKISEELEVFRKNFSNSFAQELKNPVISKNDMIKIINEVTSRFKLGNLTSNFFASIVKNRRLNLFPEIHEEFNRMARDYKKILEVEVVSTVGLNIENIKILLEKSYPDKKILLKHTLSPKILGGLQIKIGSKVIDASLKNHLEQIQKECLSAIN
ncbi:MAG: ATP synthase F1 subunit delta [Proteobacteria bacterium]|nr:ATP synthase F1 subunit delta [Pseudomonadota bacterium]NCA27965.1 ATP synthase F1 subunit delta [Pseudomonadota bacterium]